MEISGSSSSQPYEPLRGLSPEAQKEFEYGIGVLDDQLKSLHENLHDPERVREIQADLNDTLEHLLDMRDKYESEMSPAQMDQLHKAYNTTEALINAPSDDIPLFELGEAMAFTEDMKRMF